MCFEKRVLPKVFGCFHARFAVEIARGKVCNTEDGYATPSGCGPRGDSSQLPITLFPPHSLHDMGLPRTNSHEQIFSTDKLCNSFYRSERAVFSPEASPSPRAEHAARREALPLVPSSSATRAAGPPPAMKIR